MVLDELALHVRDLRPEVREQVVRDGPGRSGDTWNRLREDLQELHVGTFEGPAGTFRQRTELSTAQRDILTKLSIDPPKKIIELGPPPATS